MRVMFALEFQVLQQFVTVYAVRGWLNAHQLCLVSLEQHMPLVGG